MIRTITLAVMLMAILSVTGCGGPGAQEGSGEGSSGGEEAAEGAPNFSVTTLEGDEFRLADKRGEVVALFFMAGY